MEKNGKAHGNGKSKGKQRSCNGKAKANGSAKANGKTTGGVTGKGWKPGQSGNPAGRKPGLSITARLEQILRADDGKVASALASVIISEGLKGNYKFAREILNRVDGKVPDHIVGYDGGPIIREVAGIDIDGVVGTRISDLPPE